MAVFVCTRFTLINGWVEAGHAARHGPGGRSPVTGSLPIFYGGRLCQKERRATIFPPL